MPEGTMVFVLPLFMVSVPWLFYDASRCGAGDSEQQKQGNEVAHDRFLSQ
jgi:hypothetical protein